jgi:hypothetical protein
MFERHARFVRRKASRDVHVWIEAACDSDNADRGGALQQISSRNERHGLRS